MILGCLAIEGNLTLAASLLDRQSPSRYVKMELIAGDKLDVVRSSHPLESRRSRATAR